MCHGLPERLGGSVAMSLLYWGAQNWLLDSSLTSAEWKGTITSFAPLLIQPRVWLSLLQRGIAYSCLTCPPAPPGLLLQICFLATQPQPVLLPGAFSVQMQDFAFAVLNFMMFSSAHLSVLWRSLCTAALPYGTLATPPNSVSSGNLLRVQPMFHQCSYEDTMEDHLKSLAYSHGIQHPLLPPYPQVWQPGCSVTVWYTHTGCSQHLPRPSRAWGQLPGGFAL